MRRGRASIVAQAGPPGARHGRLGPLAPLLLAIPGSANAHLVNSGLGPFYDGVLHLLLSPGDLLVLIAVALLAGLTGAKAGRWAVIVLPMSWFGAGLLGLATGAGIAQQWITLPALIVLGVLVAVDARPASAAVVLIAVLYGVLQGVQNGAALSALGAGPSSLLGIAATVFVVALLLSALVVSLRAGWSRIAVRVAGSWIAAIGLLMLGWTLQGRA